MQMQSFSPEPRRDKTLERIESRAEPPKETARGMLREGDKQITDTKSTIETVRSEIKGSGEDAATAEQLKALESDLDSAWDDLQSEVRVALAKPEAPTEEELAWDIPEEPAKKGEAASAAKEEDLDWEIPETAEPNAELDEDAITNGVNEQLAAAFEGKPLDASFGKLAATERGQAIIRERIQDQIIGTLLQDRVNFSAFEHVATLAGSSAEVRQQLTEQLQEFVGKKFAEKLTNDPEYRNTLTEIQESLTGKVGEDGPELCRETDIRKLVLANEVLGKNVRTAALAMNLGAYSNELKINTDETKSVVYIMDPTFDEETGDCAGDIGMSYVYGEKNTGGRMERTFSKVKRGEGADATYERVGNLDLIRLPDDLKGNNVAALEAQATEKNLADSDFDAVSLHANIDIGGYAWAAKDFGWDFDHMRRTGEEQKGEDEIIQEFVTDRLDILKNKLNDSGIDLEDPAVAEVLAEYQKCIDNPLAVTPQHLSKIGKNGPKFVQAESGTYYREEAYDEQAREKDPPKADVKGSLHAGKIFLIGSDWYGKKPLKKSN